MAVPPGSRNAPRITPGSKGKAYTPVKNDKRKQGARTRHMQSQWAKEKSSNTIRNIVPGMADIATLASPSSGRGIYEQNESTYSKKEQLEEQKLFQINKNIRQLIEDLDNKKKTSLAEQKNENKAQ